VSAVEHLIGALSEVCAGLPDRRKGPLRDGGYTMTDIGLSAFSTVFMGSPSFLAHQRALAEGDGRSNCETLFGISAIPSDNYIRLMLDGAAPAAFDGLFIRPSRRRGHWPHSGAWTGGWRSRSPGASTSVRARSTADSV
jgi:hypothetical protein